VEPGFNSPLNTLGDKNTTIHLSGALLTIMEVDNQRVHELPNEVRFEPAFAVRRLIRSICRRFLLGPNAATTWDVPRLPPPNIDQFNTYRGWPDGGREYWDSWARDLIGSCLKQLPKDMSPMSLLNELSWIHELMMDRYKTTDDPKQWEILPDAMDVIFCLRRQLINAELAHPLGR
jgi:hypothetical protein